MPCTKMIVCIFTICCWICANASTISFNSSDSTIAPLTSKPLTMTCGLNASHRDVTSTSKTIKGLASIIIKRGREAIATINDYIPAKATGDLDLHVEGDVTGTSGRNAYLSVTWHHPSHTQVGDYQCEITGFTASGNMVTLTASLKIKESNEQHFITDEGSRNKDADIYELSKTMNSHIQALETKVDQLSQAKNALEAKIQALESKTDQPNQAKNSQITALEKQIHQQSSTIRSQTSQISSLNQTIADVLGKQKTPVNRPTRVFFSAGYHGNIYLNRGDTLVFDKVYDSVGGGYNSKTGEFRCPVAGHYMFQIHAECNGELVVLDIILNGVSKFARTRIYPIKEGWGHHINNSASNTVILKLREGDVVKVTSFFQSHVHGDDNSSQTTFTGLLVSPS